MKTILEKKYDELEEKFLEKRKELEKQIIKEKESNIPNEVRQLATLLHDKLCHTNHTDHCDWYYDEGDWAAWARKEYVEKAEKMLKVNSFDVAYKVIKTL